MDTWNKGDRVRVTIRHRDGSIEQCDRELTGVSEERSKFARMQRVEVAGLQMCVEQANRQVVVSRASGHPKVFGPIAVEAL